MKKILIFLPLVMTAIFAITFPICLSSCNSVSGTTTIYENVDYEYDYDIRKYKVYIFDGSYLTIEKTYKVPPKNYYYIEVNEWKYSTTTKTQLFNEYLVNTNELFVYFRK